MASSPEQSLCVTVWAAQDSPRLRYVLDWLLGERLGLAYTITHDKTVANAATCCIAYGWLENAVSIHASSLLWETDAKAHPIHCAEWQGLYTLYFDASSPCDIQFDMLAGIFYLLTRYEEYLPFTPDKHGRYPAQQSVLYPVLERPVVDEWVEAFRTFLEQVWNCAIPRNPFSYQPTYDIDIAWSYRFKGLSRTIGAALRDVAARNWKKFNQRFRVLQAKEADPYDSFIWIFTQHMDGNPPPLYFVLAALKPSSFDKNISPLHPRMTSMIRALAEGGTIGMHPSYYSNVKPQRFYEEKRVVESITQKPVTMSRQHFIRLRFPDTYNRLMEAGIINDYSMGYSTTFGFRAGTGCSFLWYDLTVDEDLPPGKDGRTELRVHPFAFMDSTARYDLGLSAGDAFDRLRIMASKLHACGGKLVTVMHNFSLGTDEEWKGWRKEYERFLHDITKTTGNAA